MLDIVKTCTQSSAGSRDFGEGFTLVAPGWPQTVGWWQSCGTDETSPNYPIPFLACIKPSPLSVTWDVFMIDASFIYLHIFPMFLPGNFAPVMLPVPAAHEISSLASPKPRVPGSNRSHLAKDLWWNSGTGWGYHGISGYPMAWSQPLKQFSLLWMNHSSHITKALLSWGVIDVDWWRLISHLIHRSGTLWIGGLAFCLVGFGRWGFIPLDVTFTWNVDGVHFAMKRLMRLVYDKNPFRWLAWRFMYTHMCTKFWQSQVRLTLILYRELDLSIA